MNSYDVYFNSICRVCLSCKSNESMVCLINNSNRDGLSYYGKAVTKFANVVINRNDELPHYMCQSCLHLLTQAINFKLKCESSDKNLLNLFKQHMKTKSNLKEIVVNFSLIKDNCPQALSDVTSSSSSEDESVDISNVKIKKHDSDSEESNNEIDHNEEQTQAEPDSDSSADEVLDHLEKSLLGLSSSDYKLLTKSRKNQKARKTFKTKRNVIKKKLQPKQESKAKIKENYVCKVCNKALANPSTYRYHMQRHTGFSYICESCGKGFAIQAELNRHQVNIHGIGPSLQCPHCAYKAPEQFMLTEHIRLHTGERPYTCDKCGLTFRRRAIWKKHMIYHKEKTVQCPHCPRKFHRVAEMQSHSNSVHERMYVYLCHKCDTSYAKTETVRRHLVEKHGIPREMQGKIMRVNRGKGVGFSGQ